MKSIRGRRAILSERFASLFDKTIDGFVDLFGSRTHFIIALVALPLWVAPIFWEGYVHWTTLIGLSGNTYESTIEYYLAVATLYQAARIMVRQNQQSAHLQKETDEIDELLKDVRELVADLHSHTTCIGHTTIGNVPAPLDTAPIVVSDLPAPKRSHKKKVVTNGSAVSGTTSAR